jgi:hypothetical protein
MILGIFKKNGSLVIGHFDFFHIFRIQFYLVYPVRWIDVDL